MPQGKLSRFAATNVMVCCALVTEDGEMRYS